MKLALTLLQDELTRLDQQISIGDATGIYTNKRKEVLAAITEVLRALNGYTN